MRASIDLRIRCQLGRQCCDPHRGKEGSRFNPSRTGWSCMDCGRSFCSAKCGHKHKQIRFKGCCYKQGQGVTSAANTFLDRPRDQQSDTGSVRVVFIAVCHDGFNHYRHFEALTQQEAAVGVVVCQDQSKPVSSSTPGGSFIWDHQAPARVKEVEWGGMSVPLQMVDGLKCALHRFPGCVTFYYCSGQCIPLFGQRGLERLAKLGDEGRHLWPAMISSAERQALTVVLRQAGVLGDKQEAVDSHQWQVFSRNLAERLVQNEGQFVKQLRAASNALRPSGPRPRRQPDLPLATMLLLHSNSMGMTVACVVAVLDSAVAAAANAVEEQESIILLLTGQHADPEAALLAAAKAAAAHSGPVADIAPDEMMQTVIHQLFGDKLAKPIEHIPTLVCFPPSITHDLMPRGLGNWQSIRQQKSGTLHPGISHLAAQWGLWRTLWLYRGSGESPITFDSKWDVLVWALWGAKGKPEFVAGNLQSLLTRTYEECKQSLKSSTGKLPPYMLRKVNIQQAAVRQLNLEANIASMLQQVAAQQEDTDVHMPQPLTGLDYLAQLSMASEHLGMTYLTLEGQGVDSVTAAEEWVQVMRLYLDVLRCVRDSLVALKQLLTAAAAEKQQQQLARLSADASQLVASVSKWQQKVDQRWLAHGCNMDRLQQDIDEEVASVPDNQQRQQQLAVLQQQMEAIKADHQQLLGQQQPVGLQLSSRLRDKIMAARLQCHQIWLDRQINNFRETC